MEYYIINTVTKTFGCVYVLQTRNKSKCSGDNSYCQVSFTVLCLISQVVFTSANSVCFLWHIITLTVLLLIINKMHILTILLPLFGLGAAISRGYPIAMAP